MGFFEYSAVNGSAKLIQGSLEAADDQAVIGWLRDRGCYPIRIDWTDGPIAATQSSRLGRLGRRPARQDVLTFTQQLHTLLSAGSEVDRSLLILSELEENRRMQRVIRQLLTDVQGGVYSAHGLNLWELEKHVAQHKTVAGFPESEPITNDQLLVMPCDILVPAALERQITETNAGKIQCRILAEAANGPTTPEAAGRTSSSRTPVSRTCAGSTRRASASATARPRWGSP